MEIPIPDDWNGTDCSRWVVCWPNSSKWRAVLQGLIESPSQGRFWDASTGNIVETQNQFRQFYDANFNGNEAIMGCNDTGLQAGLEAIASAVLQASINNSNSANASASACCEDAIIDINGGVAGMIEQPVGGNTVTIYGTQQPKVIPFGELPEGFDTKEEWDIERCQVANALTDGVISTLKVWDTISFVQVVGLAALILAGIAGGIVFPPALIGSLMGFLLIMVAVTGILTQVADYIQDNRSDFICAMMTGNSVSIIVGLLADIVDIMVSFLEVSSGVGLAIKGALLLLFNTDSLNALMTKEAHYMYPDADCSDCLCPLFSPDAASGPKEATVILEETLVSVSAGGGDYTDRDRYDVGVTINGDSFGSWCGENMSIVSWELLSGVVESGGSATASWQIYDNEGIEVYNSGEAPALPICGAYVATISAAANTWRVVIEPCEE